MAAFISSAIFGEWVRFFELLRCDDDEHDGDGDRFVSDD